ncbi:hypothetical protein FHX57_007267 [Paraburkholderia tropica]|uniref:hypothetical protein n=1 Tax=Paraburkholderia tropica TaxID=92647 RepID=UPI00160AD3C2|nr:hypothetical protein [Paraburkholderia tropica]MBB3004881.1 hypothetical protein [Paraburkholderia tropica]MBB6323903.1 hypothetical protein [Paraburkholderia tropica]
MSGCLFWISHGCLYGWGSGVAVLCILLGLVIAIVIEPDTDVFVQSAHIQRRQP